MFSRYLVLLFVLAPLASQVPASENSYEPTWESLATHPVPQWWDEGKLGIFIHWGPYSVAGYRYQGKRYAEAITSDLYNRPELYVDFMAGKFGAAPPDFGYKDMVPLFNAKNWDPAGWARLFRDSGARYVIPTGEHHDGFVLWESDLTPWTATRKGPERDLIGGLAQAVRKGRRKEYEWAYAKYGDEVPDPLDIETFRSAIIDWDARNELPGRERLALVRDLLAVRHSKVAPLLPGATFGAADVTDEGRLTAHWTMGDGSQLRLLANVSDKEIAGPSNDVSGTPIWGGTPGYRLPPWSVYWSIGG